jgi:hypothetical protein
LLQEKLLTSVEVLQSLKKGRVGRKSKLTENLSDNINEVIRAGWKEKPYDITYREMEVMMAEKNITCCHQTLQKYCASKGIKMKSCYINPRLTDVNKLSRLRFVLSQIDFTNVEDLRFKTQNRRVHIDEKWFFMERLRYIAKIIPGDQEPHNDTCQHKNHRNKIMVTAVICCPHDNIDGKLGIFPYVETHPAARASANRPRGAPVMASINVDNQSFYEQETRDDGVIHSIRQSILTEDCESPVIVQMDNAPAHVGLNVMEDLNDFAVDANLNLSFETQPPNSPDLNICDLALFNSLQKTADRLKRNAGSIEQLWAAVQLAFEQYDRNTLEICYGHLYACYNEVLFIRGDNQYRSPHNRVRYLHGIGSPLNRVAMSIVEIRALEAWARNWN